jgi:hypothetical protein
MGTRLNPGKFDCYHLARPDEPMFVLLARDEQAPTRVEDWATARFRALMARAASMPEEDVRREQQKIAEAFQCANEMRAWYGREKDRERQQEEARTGYSRLNQDALEPAVCTREQHVCGKTGPCNGLPSISDRFHNPQPGDRRAYVPVCSGACYSRGCNCAPGHRVDAVGSKVYTVSPGAHDRAVCRLSSEDLAGMSERDEGC